MLNVCHLHNRSHSCNNESLRQAALDSQTAHSSLVKITAPSMLQHGSFPPSSIFHIS